MKLVGIVPFKNDRIVVGKCINRLSEFCDAIIVIDDGSQDGSLEIVKSFSKVKYIISNPPYQKWNVFRDLEKAFEIIHNIKPEWVMYVDVDDIVDKRFAQKRDELLANKDIGRYWFKEITLWGSNKYFRVDKPEKYSRSRNRTPYLIRYNPNIGPIAVADRNNLKVKLIHFLRQSIFAAFTLKRLFSYPRYLKLKESKLKNILTAVLYPKDHHDITHVRIGGEIGAQVELDLVRIHYHYSDWQYAARKHINYALLVAIIQNRTLAEVADLSEYFSANFDEEGLKLSPVKSEWGVL